MKRQCGLTSNLSICRLFRSLCVYWKTPTGEILAVAKDTFSEGVPVGHDEALEWIPQVFRKRAKLASYDESEERLEMENYASATAAKEAMLRQFREEEAEGRMFPISEKEAKKRYPGRSLRIAAQGAIPKGEGAYRIIHDATHGVQLNNEIKSWNKLDTPGPREIATVMRTCEAAEERVIFGITGDVSKAHRRFRHKEAHWGVLACKASGEDQVVWLKDGHLWGGQCARGCLFPRVIGACESTPLVAISAPS